MGHQEALSTPISRRAALAGAAAASVAVVYGAIEGVPFAGEPATPPYDEAAAIEREDVRISHLLRRAGFGASREEHERYLAMGLTATIDELVHYHEIDDSAADALTREQSAVRAGPAVQWVIRMANTRRPLQEKMTLFWHGLLTTESSAVPDTAARNDQIEMYRRYATGDLRDLLLGITRDRAMMVYLDIDQSTKTSPNENFARELLELFSMGHGHYSEEDIREASRAFTGWHVPRVNPNNIDTLSPPIFRPELFDAGEKTFFGRRGNFGPEDIISIVLEQPQTGRYIVRRLFSFFVYPDPTEEVLDPFVEMYEYTGRNVGAVLEAMLHADVFYSREAYRALAKSPVEYAIGAIKAIGLAREAVRMLPGRGIALRIMGQILHEPPNVGGWPAGALWFSSSGMLARLNFINQVTGGAALSGGPPGSATPTPAPLPSLGTAQQALDHYLPFVLDSNLQPETREVLLEFAGGAGAPLTDATLRGLLYLLLASPQFHLG